MSSVQAQAMKPEKENWSAPPVTGFRRPREISNVVGKRLTDARIKYWQDRGFYSHEQHKARIDRAQRKPKRVGNWVEAGDGRMIYCP